MASSASTTPSSPISTPLSPTVAEEDNDSQATSKRRRLRKRKVDNNSSPSSSLIVGEPQQEKGLGGRPIKNQRNRTLFFQKNEENRILNFSQNSSSSSSSFYDEEQERRRQKQKRSLSRLRKSNRIISATFTNLDSTFTSEIKSTFTKKSTEQYSTTSYFTADDPVTIEPEHFRVSLPESVYSVPYLVHLTWRDQGDQLTDEIDKYFVNGNFSDVTLIVESTNGINEERTEIGAHKIILASYSDYFRRILEETPSKHPVMFLKEFTKWEIQTIVNFMYKGEVNVGSDQIDTLLRTAAALQIRGMAECLRGMSSGQNKSFHDRSCDIGDLKSRDESGGQGSPQLLNLSLSRDWVESEECCPDRNSLTEEPGRNGPQTARAHRPGFPIHPHHHPPFTQQHTTSASSPPFPRRKQARPRRRSGDFVAQDLRLTPPDTIPLFYGSVPPFVSSDYNFSRIRNGHEEEDDKDDIVLDFTINHNRDEKSEKELTGMEKVVEGVEMGMKNQVSKNFSPFYIGSPMTSQSKQHSSPIKTEPEFETTSPLVPDRFSPQENFSRSHGDKKRSKGRSGLALNFNGTTSGHFKSSPPSPSLFLNFNPGGNGFVPPHHSDSESNNLEHCSTPPTVSSPGGFSTPNSSGGTKKVRNGESVGSGSQTWAGVPLGPAPIFGRHRAQHSAPRGGPPRAWSNADLTEALHNVWNKKMTTSQASRIFGIPYNSLLMYVRGKYGKSLHLDVLKKGVDMALESNAAAAAAAAAAKGSTRGKGQQPLTSLVPTSPATSPSSNNATPPHNNNNTINPKGSKGKGGGGGSQNSHLGSILGRGLGGGMSPEPIHLVRQSPESNPTLSDLIPPGFNPFSMAGIFGDYAPPFPFPTVAAANAALSHILPPHHPHHLLGNSHRRVHQHNGPSEK